MTNILFLSDLHDQGIPNSKDEIMSFDIIVCLGDCTERDLSPLKHISVPKIGIHGNHDTIPDGGKDWFEDLGIQNAHLKVIDINGIKFLGFDGCMKYVFAENLNDQNDMMNACRDELASLANSQQVDFLISHYPSYGVLDKPEEMAYRGLKAFSTYIKEKHPKYHFHGHIHQEAKANIGETYIQRVFKSFSCKVS